MPRRKKKGIKFGSHIKKAPGRPKKVIIPSINDGTGWVSTPIGDFLIPPRYYQRDKMSKLEFNSIKSSLLEKKGYYDFTANKVARAILYYSDSMIIVV